MRFGGATFGPQRTDREWDVFSISICAHHRAARDRGWLLERSDRSGEPSVNAPPRLRLYFRVWLAPHFTSWLAPHFDPPGPSRPSKPLGIWHRRHCGALTSIPRSILSAVRQVMGMGLVSSSRVAPLPPTSPPLCRPSLSRHSPRGSSGFATPPSARRSRVAGSPCRSWPGLTRSGFRGSGDEW